MPEANVLCAVTAAVVVGLVVWVAIVLGTVKEPWARPFAMVPAGGAVGEGGSSSPAEALGSESPESPESSKSPQTSESPESSESAQGRPKAKAEDDAST